MDVHSRSMLSAGAVVEVPLIRLTGVVLFPTEALPLRITDSRYIAYLRSLSALRGAEDNGRNSIAVMCSFPGRLGGTFSVPVGTLAEVCSMQCTDDEVRLLARGRYRFALLSTQTDDGVLWAHVRIMDETLPALPNATMLKSAPFPKWVSNTALSVFKFTLIFIRH